MTIYIMQRGLLNREWEDRDKSRKGNHNMNYGIERCN